MSRRTTDARGECRRRRSETASRGQANLVAVAVALVILTSVLGASLAVAESTLVGATTARDATDTRAASTLAARLVAGGPTADPPNTVRERALTSESIESLAPTVENASFSIELDGRTLAQRGDPRDGSTVYRGVLIGTPVDRTASVDLAADDGVALPGRTESVTLTIDSGPNTTVHTVRTNGRIVLHNATGLSGTATVDVSSARKTELTFGAEAVTNATQNPTTPAPVSRGSGRVTVSYTTISVEPATLTVTVDV